MTHPQTTRARWARLKRVFHEASDLKDDERTKYLSELRLNEKTLWEEVATLIDIETEAKELLEAPVSFEGFIGNETRVGENFGNYKIVREIGHGGMGRVFEAVRDDGEYEQRVAIKLTNRGIFSDEIIERFKTERQILAQLEHPNIVKLLDGGVTEDSVPFYVMEYVEGKPLTTYCRKNDLSIEERLKLFVQVCEAVSYAHRNLIVHRDLKPSNVLVTEDRQIKLLDFGIAKILSEGASAQTMTENAPLTPGYSSPEQIKGGTISTASDTFSLGIMLYELLTDCSPEKIYGVTKLELPAAVCRDVPVAPSKKPETDSPFVSISAQEKKDLDNIVLKAMLLESEDRYDSVERFREDIRAYLEGRPVKAHPQSFNYRASKFVRRNMLSVAGAALALILILAGSGVAAWQYYVAQNERQIAENRFNQVRRIANSLIMEYHDEIAKLEGSLKLREKLVKDSVQYLDEISKEETDNPELLREIGVAYRKIGNVQGTPSRDNLGKLAESLESYEKSEAALFRATRLKKSNNSYKDELINTLIGIGYATARSGRHSKAIEVFDRAKMVADSMNLEASDSSRLGYAVRLDIAIADTATEGHRERIKIYEDVLSKIKQKINQDPSIEQKFLGMVNTCQERIAKTVRWIGEDELRKGNLSLAQKQFEEALKHTEELVNIAQRRFGKSQAGKSEYDWYMAAPRLHFASALSLVGRNKEALDYIEAASRAVHQRIRWNPNNKELKLTSVVNLIIYAEILIRAGNYRAAYKKAAEAFSINSKMYNENPSDFESLAWQVRLSDNLRLIARKMDNTKGEIKYQQQFDKFWKRWTREFKQNSYPKI